MKIAKLLLSCHPAGPATNGLVIGFGETLSLLVLSQFAVKYVRGGRLLLMLRVRLRLFIISNLLMEGAIGNGFVSMLDGFTGLNYIN